MVKAASPVSFKKRTKSKEMNRFHTRSIILFVSFFLLISTASAKSGKYSILTFNVMNQEREQADSPWAERSTLICKKLHGLHPDIIALQDADSIQFADITQGLPEYSTVTMPNSKANINPILYNKERLNLLSGGVHDITTYEKSSSLHQEMAVLATIRWAFFQDKKYGGSMLMVNTQLNSQNEKDLAYEATQLKTYLGKMTNQTPILLAGSFQETDEHPVYDILCSHFVKLKDCWKETKKPKGKPSTFNSMNEEAADKIVDFIFVSDVFDIGNTRIIEAQNAKRYYSDHNMLVTEVSLKK